MIKKWTSINRADFCCLLLQHRGNLFPILQQIYQSKGAIVQARFLRQQYWFVTDPDLVKQILVRHTETFEKSKYVMELKGLLGNGLLTSTHKTWKSHRRAIQPFFGNSRTEILSQLIRESLTQELDDSHARIRKEKILNLTEFTHRIILNSMGYTLFGFTREDQDQLHYLSKGTYQYIDFCSQGVCIPRWLFFSKWMQSIRFKKNMVKILTKKINSCASATKTHENFMQYLLEIHNENSDTFSFTDMIDENLTLLLAGHETTANVLVWALYHLGKNRNLQEEIRQEIQIHSTASPLLRSFFLEVMRLYPPGWIMAREAQHAVELYGVPMEKGDEVILLTWFLHRDPKFWHDPDQLIADRFLEKETTYFTSGWYFPFSMGSRTCLGRGMALAQATQVIAEILNHYVIAPTFSENLSPSFRILLHPPTHIPFSFTPIGG